MSQSEIPVIDISISTPEVAQQVLDAASTHGFLFIKNDGVTIPPKDIDDMFKLVSLTLHTIDQVMSDKSAVERILRFTTRAQTRIRHPLRKGRRHKSRLGINARRIA
jgi:hypothetical protein